jgi:hypothetical protein
MHEELNNLTSNEVWEFIKGLRVILLFAQNGSLKQEKLLWYGYKKQSKTSCTRLHSSVRP